VDRRVVGVHVANGRRSGARRRDTPQHTEPLLLLQVACERVCSDGVEERGEGRTLAEARGDWEAWATPTVVEDMPLRAQEENVHPPPGMRPQSQSNEASRQPPTVDTIVGLAEVEEDDATRLLGVEQVLDLLQVGKHVVADPPVRQEGGLSGRDDGVQRAGEARGEGSGDDFVVGVEEGDGAVVVRVVAGLAVALMDKGEEACAHARRKWEGIPRRKGGGGHLEELGPQHIPKLGVELVGQPITAGALVALGACQARGELPQW
jgi:hypothetical protein